MKKPVIIVLIAFGAWSYYTKNGDSFNILPESFGDKNSGLSATTTAKYKCDGRQYCSQMNSYEEAIFFIENCPNT